MKKCIYNTEGFTLIEILIVVAIIGVLSAIVVPVYRDYTVRGFNSAATSDLRYLKTALEAEYAEQRSYPSL